MLISASKPHRALTVPDYRTRLSYQTSDSLHHFPLSAEPALWGFCPALQGHVVHLQSAGEIMIRGRDELELTLEILCI